MKNVEDIYPLSPTQMGMLFHAIQAPQSGVYVEQICCQLHGQLDSATLQAAWHKVVHHYPALRTIFIWEGVDQPLQVVRQQVDLPWSQLDWQYLGSDEQAEKLEQWLQDDRSTDFDFSQAPISRFSLIQLAPDQYQFIWSFHHLLADGWSTARILHHVFACYENPHHQLPTSRPYRDYIAWLQKQNQTQAERLWRGRLNGLTASTTLPIFNQQAQPKTNAYVQKSIHLSEGLTANLQILAQTQRVTLNTVIQMAWAILLSRYSGENEVVFGATVSGRPADLANVEQMVGMFINTLPQRITLTAHDSILSHLKIIQHQQLETRPFEHVALSDIQRWSDLPTGQNLFNSILVFENYPSDGSTLLSDKAQLQVTNIRYLEQSNYPLSLLVIPGREMELLLIYDLSRVEQLKVERVLGHLEQLLIGISNNPKQPVADLNLLTPTEQTQILLNWNQTKADYPQDKLIHHLIEAHAKTNPTGQAVVFGNDSLTYQELDQRADQLACYLQAQGVEANTPVGLCVARSLDMIVGIVGILKAGGAYLPLDPSYPKARLAFILADTQAPLILTQQQLMADLPETAATIICLDTDWGTIVQGEKRALSQTSDNQTLAYIIYTSGSTGQPKGVPISHQNLVHSTQARLDYYPIPVDRFLLLSSFAFDSSIVGIFWSLCQGGTLVLTAQDAEQDMAALAALIAQQQITHLLALPTLYNLLLTYSQSTQLQSLKTVIVAGEACSSNLVPAHYTCLPETTLYNEYGPTEGTVWSSVYQFPIGQKGQHGPASIGWPIANMQAYILDSVLQPVPIGIMGELYIAGAGLSAGYLNRPDLTAECFINHTFANGHQTRLYKTGDLARYAEDGSIIYLGRTDDQIKLRGYRIELTEIEAALQNHPDLQANAVILHQPLADLAIDPDDIEALNALLVTFSEGQATQLLTEIEAEI